MSKTRSTEENKVILVAQVEKVITGWRDMRTVTQFKFTRIPSAYAASVSTGVSPEYLLVPPNWMQEMPFVTGLAEGDIVVFSILKARDVA